MRARSLFSFNDGEEGQPLERPGGSRKLRYIGMAFPLPLDFTLGRLTKGALLWNRIFLP